MHKRKKTESRNDTTLLTPRNNPTSSSDKATEAQNRDRLNLELSDTDAKIFSPSNIKRYEQTGRDIRPPGVSKEAAHRRREMLFQAYERIKKRKTEARKKKKAKGLKPGEHATEDRGIERPRRKRQHI